MRKGLRSCTSREKANSAVPEEGLDGCVDFGGAGSGSGGLEIVEEPTAMEVEGKADESLQSEGEGGVAESAKACGDNKGGNVGAAEGGWAEEDGSGGVDGVPVRVLRSRVVMKREGESKLHGRKCGGGSAGKRGRKNGAEVESEKCDSDRGVAGVSRGSDGDKNQKAVELLDECDRPISKRKRGRPFKSQITDGVVNEADEGVNRVTSAGERSRAVAEDNLQSGERDPPESGRRTRGRKQGTPLELLDSSGNVNANSAEAQDGDGSGKQQEGLDVTMSTPASQIKSLPRESGSGAKSRSESAKASNKKGKKGVERKKEEAGEVPRSVAKQKVRDKIVAMLRKAGWRIEYRPRNGKDYEDAVYVNPEGRTHWSVTLAYKVLKQEYDDNNGQLKAAEGFIFTPLSEDELGMLARITNKQREDKGKPKPKKKNGVSADGVTKIKQKDQSSHRKQKDAAERRKRFAPLVRRSRKEAQANRDGEMPYERPRTVLAWMIDLGTVPPSSKVRYIDQVTGTVMCEGMMTRHGIQCDCCSETFILSKFEIHAGSQPCQPYKNIHLESGASLMERLLASWNKEKGPGCTWFHKVEVSDDDPNDDTCGLCGDGGNLICCDSCPSTFHQSCLLLEDFPSDEWHCFRCTCKFCGALDGTADHQNNIDGDIASALLTCRICEEKYHEGCVEKDSATNDDTVWSTFCGKTCEEVFKRLQMILGIKQQLEGECSWTLLQRCDAIGDISHHETQKNLEGNAKLAVALRVMNELFLPIVDYTSGENLMRNLVYSVRSNLSRLNYSGFYTAILERDDEIIAVALIRIHGSHFAEMPFIGVRQEDRKKGMCRRLIDGIQSGLCSLSVEKLVIPAVSETTETWTSKFGFQPLEDSSRLRMRNMNMVLYPGTVMLQKPMLDSQPDGRTMIPAGGVESMELDHHITQDMTTCSDLGYSNGSGQEFKVQLQNSSYQSSYTNENVDLQDCATDKKHLEDKSLAVSGSVKFDLGNKSSTDAAENKSFEKCSIASEAAGHSEEFLPDSNVSTELGALEVQEGINENVLNFPEKGVAQTQNQNVITVPVSEGPTEEVRHVLYPASTNCSPQYSPVSSHQTDNDAEVNFTSTETGFHSIEPSTTFSTATPEKNSRVNGQCVSRELSSDLCRSNGGAAFDPEASNIAPIGSSSRDLIVNQNHISMTSSQHSQFDSQAEQTSSSQCTSDSMCDTKSVSGVSLLCASAGANACSSEAIILSNQAS